MPTDSIFSVTDEGAQRRATSQIPDRGDDFILRGCQLSYDSGQDQLVVVPGVLTIRDGTTVYGVEVDGRRIDSPTDGPVYYSVESDDAGAIVTGTTPAEPHLQLGSVDTGAGTTTQTNRDPSLGTTGLRFTSD